MPIYHLTLAVRGRRALARDETERRQLMRSIVRVGGPRLLLPSLVDDHLHCAVRVEQPGYLARDLRRVLRGSRPDLGLKQSHLEPVGTRAYLRWLVRYLVEQPVKHGLAEHPVERQLLPRPGRRPPAAGLQQRGSPRRTPSVEAPRALRGREPRTATASAR